MSSMPSGRDNANPPTSAEDGSKESEDTPANRSIAKSTKWIAGLTAALFAVAFVSAVISFFQWREMNAGGVDTAKLAQAAVDQAAAMEATDRAHIAFVRLEIKETVSGGRSVNAIFVNGGNTQTRDLIFKGTCNSVEPPIWPAFLRNNYRWVLAAKSSIAVDVCSLSKADVNVHIKDKRPNYIFGEAAYEDIASSKDHPRRHLTRFCVVIDNAAIESKEVLGASMSPCSRFNCADEECEKENQ